MCRSMGVGSSAVYYCTRLRTASLTALSPTLAELRRAVYRSQLLVNDGAKGLESLGAP
jgi:hypothetical protein